MLPIRISASVPFARRACAVVLAAAFPLAASAQSIPFSGIPVTVPATIEAENYDKGGEGVAYHDTTAGNAGGVYRTTDSVDLIASCDSAGGGYVVNNFQTGEWLKYTITVPASGNYDIEARVSTHQSNTAFHVEVDGVNATGSITVPNTQDWCVFGWYGKKAVPLTAGTHVLRVYADKQYFNFNSLRLVAAGGGSAPPPSGSTPYTGTPVIVPATIEAENFDKGGEGVAYHDNVKGNAGGQYRTAEDVDIVVSYDSAGGGYVINNFETGEWMKYTVNVPTTGNYDLALRTASNFSTSAFHIEVDGTNVTGRVAAPYTGDWNTFQWVTGKTGLPITAGTHVLRVVSDQQYFNLNQIRISATSTQAPPPPPPPTNTAFFCTFASSPTECGFSEQSKVPGRATITSVGRDGATAVRLLTMPGDDNVNSSGTWERDDLTLGLSSSYCNQGQEEWWAHSIMFPSDFVYTFGVLLDFHHNTSGGSPNLGLMTTNSGLRLTGFGGPTIDGGRYDYYLTDPYGAAPGSVTKNVWYDFVYHMKWSSGSDGVAEAWLNGKKVMSYSGATLYTGVSCYLKLANYHEPSGSLSSVIHDRVVRGSSAASVALTPLEGVP